MNAINNQAAATNSFEGKVDNNPAVLAGTTTMHAVITIKSNAQGNGAAVGAAAMANGQRVLGFVVDCSGSMSGDKMRNARQATIRAVESLPEDGSTYFFVVRGGDTGQAIVSLQEATAANKARAVEVLKSRLTDEGGTYFARWLSAARGEFDRMPGAIKVLIFLTDGKNEGESGTNALDKELAKCSGLFEVESRGVGDSYVPEELRKIQKALGGSVDGFQRADQLAADFDQIVDRTKGLARSNVKLRIWAMMGARIAKLEQMTPQIVDLTSKLVASNKPLTMEVDTGAWGEEARTYMVKIEIDPANVGAADAGARRMANVTLAYVEGGVEHEVKLAAGGQVMIEWTADEKRSAVINPVVAHHSGQGEIARNIQEGVAAMNSGDNEKATRALGKALEQAHAAGNEEATRAIKKIITVDEKGTVRINKSASKGDVVSLDTASTRTRRVGK